MARERYVLLGVAATRSAWFRVVGQWATSAAIPAEFVRCVSLAELCARLTSNRPFSAVLVDGQLGGVDRDVAALAEEHGCALIVVDDRGPDVWRDLGAAAVLAPDFTRDDLLDVLTAHADPVGDAVHRPVAPAPTDVARRGGIVAVLGSGGVGTSTAAIALAQGLASGPHAVDGPVLLADLCRSADQAMLHDSRVVIPGVQELVEAHRTGHLSPALVRDQTFEVPDRGYRLLLGLRRPRHWAAIRPRALDAALDALQRTFAVTVCDVDPDLEGEAETGSVDVEERHLLTRATVARASVVLVVGAAGVKGLFSLVRLVADVLAFGVPVDRVIPVISRGPRGPRARAELAGALRELCAADLGERARDLLNPVHLPERAVEQALRDGTPLPRPLAQTLAAAYGAILARAGGEVVGPAGPVPARVVPGSLARLTPTGIDEGAGA